MDQKQGDGQPLMDGQPVMQQPMAPVYQQNMAPVQPVYAQPAPYPQGQPVAGQPAPIQYGPDGQPI